MKRKKPLPCKSWRNKQKIIVYIPQKEINSAEENMIDKELKQIVMTLKKTGWNKTKTARLLGISRQTLYRKLKKSSSQISL